MTVLDRPSPVAPVREDEDVRRPIAGIVVAVSLSLVGLLVVALAVGGGGTAWSGALVDQAVPVARLAGRIAALGTVGALLFAAVLHPSAAPLPAASRQALRAASVWATAWAAATAVFALLTVSRLVGAGSVPPAALWTFVSELPAGQASLLVLAVSALLAAVAHRARGPVAATVLLALAVAGVVVPAVLTGHSAEADHHLLAVTGLGVHVLAASLWVGGLLALLVHGRGRAALAPAATRFSAVALACFLATGTSGVLAAWLIAGDLGLSAVLATGYGWLLAAKTAGLTVLGVLGWWHRRRTLPRLRAGEPGSFRRFAVVETGVLLATVALAVALSASPPPAAGAAPPQGATAPAAPAPGPEDMSGHDHGDLSVTVLVDETRFHVSAPVDAGSRVTVHNATGTEVTITAQAGSFDVVVPGHALMTFPAPDLPGSYAFTSRHSASFAGVLVVR